MYLTINGNRYTVSRRIANKDTIKYLTVSPAPEEISGTIQMYDNSGFLISEDNADSFQRYTYSGTLLILTNQPEPIPVISDEPAVKEPSSEEILLESAADHEARLCMIELGV